MQPTAPPRTAIKNQFVRSIDALERLFYRYAERNPALFCIAAEFDERLSQPQLRTALATVQQRHPLLSLHVEDHVGTRLGFYRAETVEPIELTVHETVRPWQSFAAAELARPFDRSVAPLIRAVLVYGKTGSTVLLTLDHTIGDGVSSACLMHDLVRALNGEALSRLSVPCSVEDIIARELAGVDIQITSAASDPRMTTPVAVRPFDGTRPFVHTETLDSAETSRLVQRCRSERTTVHAALMTAAAQVHAATVDKDFTRVMSPIDIRPLLNIGGDCADYFMCTVNGVAPRDGRPFWDQARSITAELTVARSAQGITAASAAIQQAITVDAGFDDAARLFTLGLPFELMITNLGVRDLHVDGPLRPTALWGPIVQTHVDDHVIGVVTYGGSLRMFCTGPTPGEGFLKKVKATSVAILES